MEKAGEGKADIEVDALKFLVKAEATPTVIGGERYSLDYEKLAGFTKISSVSLAFYANGTLKTLNAAAEDRSAAIVADTAKSAFAVAKIAMGIPGAAQAQGNSGVAQMLVCAPRAQQLLDKLKEETASLKLANAALDKVTEQVNALTSQLAIGTLNAEGKGTLQHRLDDQKTKAKAVADQQSAVEKATAALSLVTVERAPVNAQRLNGELDLEGPDLAKFTKLVTRKVLTAGPNAVNQCDDERIEDCVSKMVQAQWVIESLAPAIGAKLAVNDPAAIHAAKPQPGVFIRPPEPGRLLVCKASKESDDCTAASADLLFKSPDSMIPQLGQLRFLPFINGPFQNNSLSLALNENGGIDSFEYKNLKARGEVLAGAIADATSQGVAFADASRKKKLDAIAAEAAAAKTDRETQIALLQFQIDSLTKQAEITKLGNTDIALLQSQIDNITKEKELDKLTQPPAVTELDSVKADTELAVARKTLYEALRAQQQAKEALGTQ